MKPEEFHLQLHLSTQTSQVVFTIVFTTIFGIKSLFFHKPVWSLGGGGRVRRESNSKHFTTIYFKTYNDISHHFLIRKYSVQSLSCVRLFAIPWTEARQAFLSITNSQSLLKLMSTESVIPSNHLIFCHLLLLLPSFQ